MHLMGPDTSPASCSYTITTTNNHSKVFTNNTFLCNTSNVSYLGLRIDAPAAPTFRTDGTGSNAKFSLRPRRHLVRSSTLWETPQLTFAQ